MKDNIEELTKEEFEQNLSGIVEACNKVSNKAVKLFNESEFYKQNGYRLKYYYDSKSNEYSYTYEKIEIGFIPPYKKSK